MLQWIGRSNAFSLWMLIGSAVMFGGALILLPILLARISENCFAELRRANGALARIHPALRCVFIVVKNLIGFACVFFGVRCSSSPAMGS